MARLPHGTTILKQLLDRGLGRFLQAQGFKRARFSFRRQRPPLSQLITFSINQSRSLPRKHLWMIASSQLEGLLPIQLSYELISLDHGYDAGDLSVGLAHSLEQRFLPELDALHDAAELGRRLERDRRLLDAVTVYRHANLVDDALRLELADQGKTPVRSTIRSAADDDITQTPPASGSTA